MLAVTSVLMAIPCAATHPPASGGKDTPRYIPAMHLVAVAITEDVPLFELAVPCEVFGVDRPELAEPWYAFRLCATVPGSTRTAAGLVADTTHDLSGLLDADTVVVPACSRMHDEPPADLVDIVRTAHRGGARIISICSGAFVLAAAGLLDGRRAAVHWMHAAKLRQRYPQVIVDPAVLYIDHGDVVTSAGTAAGLDACLHVVRRDHGAAVANALARRLVVAPHRPGGQAQYVQAPIAVKPTRTLAPALDWALAHLHEPLTVDRLAHQVAMSARTFTRRFRGELGTTPIQWLLAQRIALAQQLLESTGLPVERVAQQAGFGTSAGLRTHFVRTLGVPPQTYRATFRETATPEDGRAVPIDPAT